MMYGLEMVALTKRQAAELEVAELKMLRFPLGMMRRDSSLRGVAEIPFLIHRV